MRIINLMIASLCFIAITATYFTVKSVSNRSVYPAYEYQLRLEPDSTYIYSDGRLIGTIESWKPGIDSTIWHNNQ